MQILSRGIATAGRAVARHNIALALAMMTSIALLSFPRPAAALNIPQITS